MENIKAKEIPSLLEKHEWLVLFINADWCAHCQETKKYIPSIIGESPDMGILGLDAQDSDNTDLLKDINFETLPYFAVFHSKKEGFDFKNPMTYFVGGDTGDQNTLSNMVAMIKQIRAPLE